MFERVPKFVKKYGTQRADMTEAVKRYAEDVKARKFPTDDNLYHFKK